MLRRILIRGRKSKGVMSLKRVPKCTDVRFCLFTGPNGTYPMFLSSALPLTSRRVGAVRRKTLESPRRGGTPRALYVSW